MRDTYNKIKNNILSDNFIKNTFYINTPISGSTFFIASIIRLLLISFIAHIIPNSVFLYPLIAYLSYNTISSRVKSITANYKPWSVLLTIFWSVSLIANINYLVLVRVYGVQYGLFGHFEELPHFEKALLISRLFIYIHIVSTAISALSVLLLSLIAGRSGENNLFSIDSNRYYSQRRYLNLILLVFIVNLIIYSILTGLIIYSGAISYGFSGIGESYFIRVITGLTSLFSVVIYFYNTSSRIKDFGLCRAWVILLYFLGFIAIFASPIGTYGSTVLASKISGTSLFTAAYSMYIGPFIDLLSRPVYNLLNVVYFILMFFPGKKVVLNG